MMNIRHRNTLEGLLERAGYPTDHAIIWADMLLRQVQPSVADSTLVCTLIRRASVEVVRDALAEMPPHIYALCLARMVAFGMTEDEIKRLMPQEVTHG